MKYQKHKFMFFFVFLFSSKIFAIDFFAFDLKHEIGTLLGQINEYVFIQYDYGEYQISKLDWDLLPVVYFGAEASATFFEHFVVSLKGKIGLPSKSGKMQDYDWLNATFDDRGAEWIEDHYWVTNYSCHQNVIEQYYDATFSIGGIVNLPVEIYMQPFTSVRYQNHKFMGKKGYRQYAEQTNVYGKWEEDMPKISFNEEKVISYEQTKLFFSVGLLVFTKIVPQFYFSAAADFSFYSKIAAHDVHLISKKEYMDYPEGFGAWNFELAADYSFTKMNHIGLKLEYQLIPILKGPNYSKDINAKLWSQDTIAKGGVSSSIFSISLFYRLSI